MPLTPLDILHREFRRGFRGYLDRDVQDFLIQISHEFEKLVTENARLREEVENARQRLAQYERIEDTMQNALVVAQKTAEETKRGAEKRIELMLADAEQKRKQILEKAHQEVSNLEAQCRELQLLRQRFELEFRATLQTFQHMLGSQEKATPDTPELVLPLEESSPSRSVESASGQSLLQPASDSERKDVSASGLPDNGSSEEDTLPRHRLIDWRLVGAHLESDE